MKKKKTDIKSPGVSSRPIRIEFHHPTASAISIAGTFNDWRPEVTPMVSLGQGCWFKELVLEPGSYEYRLVVDGQWMPDPRVAETKPNPFGGTNSVLKVNDRP
jgi:5'-AMP-activated protein kinase regulatory beta subunit